MSCFFGIFFGIVAICAVIYGVQLAGDLFSKKQSAEAVVVRRYTENFPLTVVSFRRDRKDLHLVFLLTDGRELDLLAYGQIYEECPVGTGGLVTWRGSRVLTVDVAPTNP